MKYTLFFLGLLGACAASPPVAPRQPLDPVWEGMARRMVDFIAQTHPNPWRRASKNEVLTAALRAAEPGLSDGVRRARLTAALAKIREGHTRPSTLLNPQRRLPLDLGQFSDGLAVVRVLGGDWEGERAPADLLGARLISIGGQAVGNLQVRLADYACAENSEGVLAEVPSLIVDADILADVGVLGPDGRVDLEFLGPGNQLRRVRVSPLPGTSAPVLGQLSGPRAAVRSQQALCTEVVHGGRVAYLSYNVCQEGPDFAEVTRSFLEAAQSPGVERIVVDLRFNGGGNSWPFSSQVVPRLAEAAKTKKLMVLAGPRTFSSAIIALCELRNLGAVFVGSPTGAGANGYGEVKGFRLAAGQYEFITSSKFFELVPGMAEGAPLIPDHRIEASAADHAAERDPVLDFALAL